ncbi:hypothetical protein MOSE0_J05380 [Monosporozyma servazzii]
MSDNNPSKTQVGAAQANTDIDLDDMINATESLTSDIFSQADEKTKKKKNKKKKKKKAKKVTTSTQTEPETAALGKDKNLDSIMIGIEEYLHDDTDGIVNVNIKDDGKEADNANETTVIENKDLDEAKQQSVEPEHVGIVSSDGIETLTEESDDLPVGDETTIISEITHDETKPKSKRETLSTLQRTNGQIDDTVYDIVDTTQKNNNKNNDESVEPKIINKSIETGLLPETQKETVLDLKPELVDNDDVKDGIESLGKDYISASNETKVVQDTKEPISDKLTGNIIKVETDVKQESEMSNSFESDVSMKSENESTLTKPHHENEEINLETTEELLPEEHQEIEPASNEAKLSKHETSIQDEGSSFNGNEGLEISSKEEPKSSIENFENSKVVITSEEGDKLEEPSDIRGGFIESELQQLSSAEIAETKPIESREASPRKEVSSPIKPSGAESNDEITSNEPTEEDSKEEEIVKSGLENSVKDKISQKDTSEVIDRIESKSEEPVVKDEVADDNTELKSEEPVVKDEVADDNTELESEEPVVKDEVADDNTELESEEPVVKDEVADDNTELESEEPVVKDEVADDNTELKSEEPVVKDEVADDNTELKSEEPVVKDEVADDNTELKSEEPVVKDEVADDNTELESEEPVVKDEVADDNTELKSEEPVVKDEVADDNTELKSEEPVVKDEVADDNTELKSEEPVVKDEVADDNTELESEEPVVKDEVADDNTELESEEPFAEQDNTTELKSSESAVRDEVKDAATDSSESAVKDHESRPQQEEKKEADGIEALSFPGDDKQEVSMSEGDEESPIPLSEEKKEPVKHSSLDDLFAETEALLNDLNFVDDSELSQLLNMGGDKSAKQNGINDAEEEEDVIRSSDIVKMNEREPVYLYTSLAGGGFHMVPRTNRLATILQANRIEFTYRDLGTDDEARKVWKTYGRGRMLPAVVRGRDTIVGNWEEMEEFNEDYRTRQAIYEAL